MLPETDVDTSELARFLLLTTNRIRQLVTEGVLEKVPGENGAPLRGRFNLLASVNNYIRYLRSRTSASSADEYTTARARRMSAMADIEQLR